MSQVPRRADKVSDARFEFVETDGVAVWEGRVGFEDDGQPTNAGCPRTVRVKNIAAGRPKDDLTASSGGGEAPALSFRAPVRCFFPGGRTPQIGL